MTGELDLRTLGVIAFKFQRRAITVFVLCVGLAAAASFLLPEKYSATASVLVKVGRELIYRPDIGSSATPLPNVDKDEMIASNIAIMQSASIRKAVINRIGLERLYPDIAGNQPGSAVGKFVKSVITEVKDIFDIAEETPMRQAERRFDRGLSIEVVKKTSIINVSFLHSDPVIAADVANTVVELFQEQVGQIYDNPNLKFEEDQVGAMRVALATAEDKLNTYRRSHNVYDLDDQIQLLLKQKVDIDSKLKDSSSQIVQLQGLTTAIAAQTAVTPRSVSLYTETERHRSTDDATMQLLQLQLQERQMATRFGNDYPQLVEVRNQIRVAQAAVAAQKGDAGSHTRTGVNDVRTTLDQSLLQNQAQLQSLFGARETLRSQVADLDTEITNLSKTQPELVQLERDVDLRTAAVKTSYDKLVEARAVEGLNHEKPSSFSLYQAATPSDPADPARPLPLLYMLVGFVVGTMGAIVTLFLSYRMFNGFLTPKQAAIRLDRPMLAVIDYNRRFAAWRRSAGLEQSDAMVGVRGDSRAVSV